VQLFVITLTFRSCTKHDQNFLIIYLNPSWFDVCFFFMGNYDAHPWALQPWSSHVWEAEKFPVNLEQNKHGRTWTCQEFMLKDEPVDSMHNVVLNFCKLWVLLQYLSACHAILLSAQFRSLHLNFCIQDLNSKFPEHQNFYKFICVLPQVCWYYGANMVNSSCLFSCGNWGSCLSHRLCIVIKCEILDAEWDLNIYVVFHGWHWPGECKDTLQSGCESPW
jgi:hypothetical protein